MTWSHIIINVSAVDTQYDIDVSSSYPYEIRPAIGIAGVTPGNGTRSQLPGSNLMLFDYTSKPIGFNDTTTAVVSVLDDYINVLNHLHRYLCRTLFT